MVVDVADTDSVVAGIDCDSGCIGYEILRPPVNEMALESPGRHLVLTVDCPLGAVSPKNKASSSLFFPSSSGPGIWALPTLGISVFLMYKTGKEDLVLLSISLAATSTPLSF